MADFGTYRCASSRRVRSGVARSACLVARRAELWLLDEPHAGLDAAGRDELDAVLRQAVGSGATVMVASHELERAGSLADRIVDVQGGRIGSATDGGRA